MKIQEKSESFCFSQKFPAFEAIIYRTGFLDIRYLLGLSIYLLISTRCRYSHGFGSLLDMPNWRLNTVSIRAL